jgi:AcrR family transcriptional regulator
MSDVVQKSAVRRGRPRAYNPEVALGRAMEVFWAAGYAATSLDDLSKAMRMNRPSLYAAFGDKRAIYRALLARYRANARAGMASALAPDVPLRTALRRAYQMALSLYLPRGAAARGCFWISTAIPQAVLDAQVRAEVAAGLRELDDAFEARIRLAKRRGELGKAADPAALAKMASAALYALAIRSRGGASRATLEGISRAAIDLILRS